MSHDPRALDIIAGCITVDYMATVGQEERDADSMLDALEAHGLAVIEVGTVPPWMEWAACRTDFGLGNEWFYDDLGMTPEDWQPLYIIREDKP